MNAWVLNTIQNLGGTLIEKTKEYDGYVSIQQDILHEWCNIADPHFLLPPFHTQIGIVNNNLFT
jgi:hypothetical protein